MRLGVSFKTSKCHLETGPWQIWSALSFPQPKPETQSSHNVKSHSVFTKLDYWPEMKPDGWSPKLSQPGRTKNEMGPQSPPAKSQRSRAEIFVPDGSHWLGAPRSARPHAAAGASVIFKGNDRFLSDPPDFRLFETRASGFWVPGPLLTTLARKRNIDVAAGRDHSFIFSHPSAPRKRISLG